MSMGGGRGGRGRWGQGQEVKVKGAVVEGPRSTGVDLGAKVQGTEVEGAEIRVPFEWTAVEGTEVVGQRLGADAEGLTWRRSWRQCQNRALETGVKG